MSNYPTVTDKEWLAEIDIDQVELLMLISERNRFFQQHYTDPVEILNKVQEDVIDIVRRLLEHKEIIALLERIGENTEVWDFDADKVISILEKNWDIYKEYPALQGSQNFILYNRKNLPFIERGHAKPIIYLNKAPAS